MSEESKPSNPPPVGINGRAPTGAQTFGDVADAMRRGNSTVRWLSASASPESQQYGNNLAWVANPANPAEKRLRRRPALASEVDGNLDLVRAIDPRARTRFKSMVRHDGNVVDDALTAGAATLPEPGRHAVDGMHRHRLDVHYASGWISTETCLHRQIAKEQVNPALLLVPPQPCAPDCCDGEIDGHSAWDGTPLCPATRKEREFRLARHAERQNAIETAFTNAQDERELRLQAKASANVASVVSSAVAEALRQQRELDDASKKGRR